MNFYDKVVEQNALEWYRELPLHLRKVIDTEKSKFKGGRVAPSTEAPEIFEQVKSELGARPLRPAEPADPLDGYTHAQIAQYEAHKKWGARYDELLLIKIVTDLAPGIQKERRALNEAMGLNVDAADLPSQADGLDTTQAATVRWIQQTGETPLEHLAGVYRSDDPSIRTSDKISAAKALLDFVHRRVPVKTEVDTRDTTAPKISQDIMRKLSTKELDVLEKLLKKLGNEV